ncbi:MAG: DUF4235 domain-containing protein [Solirubrobacterales bacterium]
MKKVLFVPVGVLAGLIAGFVARRTFERIWALVDSEDPPEPDRRGVSVAKLAAALALEGAIFRLAKGLTEHGARSGFASATGRWPGTEPELDEQAD